MQRARDNRKRTPVASKIDRYSMRVRTATDTRIESAGKRHNARIKFG